MKLHATLLAGTDFPGWLRTLQACPIGDVVAHCESPMHGGPLVFTLRLSDSQFRRTTADETAHASALYMEAQTQAIRDALNLLSLAIAVVE